MPSSSAVLPARLPSPERALVADIGGTNVRLALVPLDDPTEVADERHWRVGDFASLADAARAYLAEIGDDAVRFGMVGVAAPTNDDRIRMTNSAWDFSLDETRRAIGLEALFAVNDFAANGWGVTELGRSQFARIGGPEALPPSEGTFAVVGPGTGLGVGAILKSERGISIIPSEGGHVDFAPVSDEELEIFAWLRQRHHRVSYERLLCGPGLVNIYHAIGGDPTLTDPARITAAHADSLAARAMAIFCEVLGSFAGNAALTFGAWDGVYLAGGMLRHMKQALLAGGFRARFDDKGRFGRELARVPTLLVEAPSLGLIGAAAALRQRVGAQ